MAPVSPLHQGRKCKCAALKEEGSIAKGFKVSLCEFDWFQSPPGLGSICSRKHILVQEACKLG